MSNTLNRYICIFLLWAFYSHSTNVFGQGCSGANTDYPQETSFENNLGIWSQGTNGSEDDFDWTINGGSTASPNTGPSGPNDGSSYIYMEASGSNYPAKTSYLESGCLYFENGVFPFLSFSYHMYGDGIGELYLEVSTNDGGSWTSLWQKSGNQGDVWLYEFISLSDYLDQNIQLRFRGVTGSGSNGWQSDISLDQVIIESSQIADCSLEPVNDTITLCNTNEVTGTVASNDPLPNDYANLNYIVTDDPNNGTLVLNNDGSFEYTATGSGAYVDIFTYGRSKLKFGLKLPVVQLL